MKQYIPRYIINRVVEACMQDFTVREAVAYVSPVQIVKVTRRHKPDARNKSTEFVLTIGKPNFAGRKFAKLCIQAGEKFPVRKVQLKFYPEKRR